MNTDTAVSKKHKPVAPEPDDAAVELYRRYRPRQFKDVLGQEAAVRVLEEFVKRGQVPHALLFTGPSGCGKTTLARILRRRLQCSKHDYVEVNAAEARGIDTVRDIQQRAGLFPAVGPTRAWCIDECHRLTPDAQSALLKTLEDTPKHVYFLLCTTDPNKLLKTIHTRCTEVRLAAVDRYELMRLITSVVLAEKAVVAVEVMERITEYADGSARKALVLLGQVLRLPGEKEQLAALERGDSRRQAIDLCRCLLNPRSKWGEVAAILKALGEDPEAVRRAVLGYMGSVLLSGGKLAGQAMAVIGVMRDHLFDAGKPGLIANCWEIFGKR